MFTDASEGDNIHLRPSADARGQVPEWKSLASQPEQNKENHGPVTKWNDPLRDTGNRRRVQNCFFFFSSLPLCPSLWVFRLLLLALPFFCPFIIKGQRGGPEAGRIFIPLNYFLNLFLTTHTPKKKKTEGYEGSCTSISTGNRGAHGQGIDQSSRKGIFFF